MSVPLQLFIVGAGPTGLALALLCRRLGIRLRIVDKRIGTPFRAGAMGILPRASELLACMGLYERFGSYGNTPDSVNVYTKGRRRAKFTLASQTRRAATGAFEPREIQIPQPETERILYEALQEQGCQVEWNTELVGFAQSEDRISAHLRRNDRAEEIMHCEWLVSCEGAAGVSSRFAGIAFKSEPYPMAFLTADVELETSLDRDSHHVWIHPDGVLAALPCGRPQGWRLFFDVTKDAGDLPSNVTSNLLQWLFRSRTVDVPIAVTALHWASWSGVDYRVAAQFRQGRVLLAGDAAHVHNPTGGQGLALGLQDAMNLAWKLGRVLKGAPVRLLDTYCEERSEHARRALHEIHRMLLLFVAPDLPLRILRDHVTIPSLRRPGIQQRLFQDFAQLNVSYRDSALCRHQDQRALGRTNIRAGDCAPDFSLARGSGEVISLFQLLMAGKPVALIGPGEFSRGEGFVDRLIGLLEAVGIDAALIAAKSEVWWHSHEYCLIDSNANLQNVYGLEPPFLCLIRPDAHVGLIQIPIHEAALLDYARELSPESGVPAVDKRPVTERSPS